METCKYGSGAGKRKPTAAKRKGVVCRAYMSQGRTPTLPQFLKNNQDVLNNLLKDENKELRSFILNEYKAMEQLLDKADCPTHLFNPEEIKKLGLIANKASKELQCLTHNDNFLSR